MTRKCKNCERLFPYVKRLLLCPECNKNIYIQCLECGVLLEKSGKYPGALCKPCHTIKRNEYLLDLKIKKFLKLYCENESEEVKKEFEDMFRQNYSNNVKIRKQKEGKIEK